MCRAAYCCQEPTSGTTRIRPEPDPDEAGAVAGEGAGDGGAGIPPPLTPVSRSTATHDPVGIFDHHMVKRHTYSIYTVFISIETVKGEGDCLSIG